MGPDMYDMNMTRLNKLPPRKLLDLLVEAMKDERHDNKKYKMMMEMTENKEIRENIRYACEDEAKHYRMFQEIYEDLTGEEISVPVPKVDLADRFIDNVKSSIQDELKAVEMYREIRAMLNSKKHRDMLFEIITDEQEHATRFVYIYAMIR
jgi:rubrerythrin